jgi:hypothetical protein
MSQALMFMKMKQLRQHLLFNKHSSSKSYIIFFN